MSTSGVALAVTVVADTTFTDHVAVYQTLSGFSLTVRRSSGNFTLDLSSFAGKTVVICLFGSYAIGSLTSSEIRGYELAPSDTFTGATENAELLVLGTVTVPASGTIPAGNITHDRRRSAWQAAATEATPWSPLLRNPGFEYGETSSTQPYGIADWFNRSDLATNGSFRLGTTTVNTGSKSLEFNKTSTSASTGSIFQFQELAVTSGGLIKLTGFIRQLIAPTAGTYAVVFAWGDLNSTATTTTSVTISASGVDAGFRSIDRTIAIPVGAATLKSIAIAVTGVTSLTTGVAAVFDDFQVFLENPSAQTLPGNQNQQFRQDRLSSAIIEDTGTFAQGALAALLRFDKSTPSTEGTLVVDRKDQNYSGGNLPPALGLAGRAILGSQLVSSEAKALLARITAPPATVAGADFTLLWETAAPGLKGVRIYVGDLANTALTEPGFFVTINARYDGALWNKDVNGVNSTALYLNALSSDMFATYSQISPNTWNSAAWVRRILGSVLGDVSIGRDLNVLQNIIGSGSILLSTFDRYTYTTRTAFRSGLSFVPIFPCVVEYDLSPVIRVRNTSGTLNVACDITEYIGDTTVKQLKSASFEIVDAVGTTLQAQILMDGGLVHSSAVSAGSGGIQTLTITGLPDAFFVNTVQLRVVTASGAATGCEVRRVFVTMGY
jgi:hypothetical protein